MKRRGHTLLELALVLTVLGILTAVSLVPVIAPKTFMEKEDTLTAVASLLNRAQYRAIIQGAKMEISITPVAIWVNEQKALTFEESSPWRIQSSVSRLILHSDSQIEGFSDTGERTLVPLSIKLLYNQNESAHIDIQPQWGVIRFARGPA
jgi:prepilin-type N-terminal cleavage/methylation domain-containing protein